jgi:hypothetical protein
VKRIDVTAAGNIVAVCYREVLRCLAVLRQLAVSGSGVPIPEGRRRREGASPLRSGPHAGGSLDGR